MTPSSYDASRFEKNWRALRAFSNLQKESPQQIHRTRVQRGDYGPRSGISQYRINAIATKSLTSRTLTGCELLSLWYLSDKDPNARSKYQPVFINGRRVQ